MDIEKDIEIDHIGIAVESITDVLGFYESLGLKPTFQDIPSQAVRVAFLPLGNQAQIELLEATSPESVIHRFLKKRGPGLHHIALRVSNLKQVLKHFQEKGFDLIDTEPRVGADGHQVAFVHPKAAQGVLIEFTEKRTS